MKRKIEVTIDVPNHIDDELSELLLYLSDDEIDYLKGFIHGILMRHNRLSLEEIFAISKKYGKSS